MYQFSGLLTELRQSLQPSDQPWRGQTFVDQFIDQIVTAVAHEIGSRDGGERGDALCARLRSDPQTSLAMDLAPEVVADFLFERVAQLNYSALRLGYFLVTDAGEERGFDLRDEPLYRDLRRLMNARRYSYDLLRDLARASAAHENVSLMQKENRPLNGVEIDCVIMSVQLTDAGLKLTPQK